MATRITEVGSDDGGAAFKVMCGVTPPPAVGSKRGLAEERTARMSTLIEA
jgi:hypothetical protein